MQGATCSVELGVIVTIVRGLGMDNMALEGALNVLERGRQGGKGVQSGSIVCSGGLYNHFLNLNN